MSIKQPDYIPTKIALVHEWFSPKSFGGAELVVKSIDELLLSMGRVSEFIALIDGESHREQSWLYKRQIKTSLIQKLPWGVDHVQKYLPLMPFAIEQLDLSEYPLVISSNHLVAKGVLTSPDQLHISYVHTPVRYAWDQMNVYLRHSTIAKFGFENLIRFQLHALRQWDQLSASRVDYLIANSRFTARRIKKYWGRNAEVIHPPVDVDRFRFDKERDEFYLCVSRLVPNKRVDLVIQAFNRLRLPLLIVGEGAQKKYLEKLAGPTIKLLGYQDSMKVETLMETCRAFVYAGVEDFGIAPVEAMAAGAPVIAFKKGGLLDTVKCATQDVDSSTGVFFQEQTIDSLFEAVDWFESKRVWKDLNSERIRIWAENFRPELFSLRFEKSMRNAWYNQQQSIDCC